MLRDHASTKLAQACYKRRVPKVVDPVQRRTEVFDAVFAVIVDHGLQAVSLRRVADQAGLAIGSVRHYFDSAEAMLTAAADEVITRISRRLERRRDEVDGATAEPRRILEEMLAELMPWDEPRTRETTVWLEFAVASRTVPAFRSQAERLHRGVRELAALALRSDALVPDDRVGVEAERLAALIDGLGLGGTLHPTALPPERARAALRLHLDSLVLPSGNIR